VGFWKRERGEIMGSQMTPILGLFIRTSIELLKAVELLLKLMLLSVGAQAI
jgi:hypothetical protein